MRACFGHLEPLLALAAGVPGDVAELGVWRGDTFAPLAAAAAAQGRNCHAVDSFAGMAKPSEHDRDDRGLLQYPRGSLDPGSTDPLLRALAREHVDPARVRVWQGWIPEVFRRVDLPRGLAFMHVDLDQYDPTLEALLWAWPRMNPGGVVACHDWFEGRTFLAAGAIREFMAGFSLQPSGHNPASKHLWFVKGEAPNREAPNRDELRFGGLGEGAA